MHRYLRLFAGLSLGAGLIVLGFPAAGSAQAPAAPPSNPVAQAPPPTPGEREIMLEREHPLETLGLGLGKPELFGFRISGFFVGSANYNNRIQIVPEFAGSAFATSQPGQLNFSFDKFTIGVNRTFAPWLSAGASISVEQHKNQHSHGFDPDFGCPGTEPCIEQFGSEDVSTETDLHRFYITAVAPLGNGLAISFGRFDTPYGYERHDANLNFTATISELQQFGRPQSMTGFMASYQFTPWLDASAWIVNRWENETTEDDFNDNNNDKSFGGRIGFTPLQGRQLLNFGIGGWLGPEQDDNNHDNRWIIDADLTWTPMPKLLLAAEFLYGGEQGVTFRRVGTPPGGNAATNKTVNWLAFYGLVHYDIKPWLGLSFRYGIFDDQDGARTGVKQTLQSFTIVPTLRLSRLIPDLRPVGATYARTRHPLDWVDVKLEYRFNVSDKEVFSDNKQGVPITSADKTSQQVTLQFVVNF